MLGVFLYSTGPVFVQASGVSGPVFSFWRLWMGVAVFGVATWLHLRGRGARPSASAWRVTLGAGVAFGAHQLLLFSAIEATSVADVTLVATLSPIVTAVLAVPMFDERPGRTFRAWWFLGETIGVLHVIGGAVTLAGVAGAVLSPAGRRFVSSGSATD